MKNHIAYIAVLFMLFSSACATYHLSTQSLLEQFAGSQKEKKLMLVLAPPFLFFPGIVDGNDLTELEVLDKYDLPHIINVTTRTGVRITRRDNKKTTFYFNTLLLKDSTITGSKTHFFRAMIRPILLSDIARIEIQK